MGTIEAMGSESNGGPCRSFEGERLNVFALVIYIPPPLGQFLDDLRRELVPHYNPHAHVSVLPPRPLRVEWETASGQARTLTEEQPPFEVELTSVQVFPKTDVIYLGIGSGGGELHELHRLMNSSALEFAEPYEYHPHITLAQCIPHEAVAEMAALAQHRWEEFNGPRSFRADRAVFVQNTSTNCWLDLAEYSLGAVAVR
jgi:2'-5' RNA ligase